MSSQRDVKTCFACPRITQPPGGNASDIFGLDEENGNIETVEEKPDKYDSIYTNTNKYSHYYYRMASSFVLGHDQLDNDMDQPCNMQSGKYEQ